jgi:hypothetical protein
MGQASGLAHMVPFTAFWYLVISLFFGAFMAVFRKLETARPEADVARDMSLRGAKRRSNFLLLDSTCFLRASGDYHREYAWRGFASAALRLGMTTTHIHLHEVLVKAREGLHSLCSR